MWYAIIRLFLGFLVGISTFFILRKTKIKKTVILRLSPFLMGLVSYYVFFCIPIENLFINFSTPEKAFYYLHSGDITATINGDSSALILYKNNDANSWVIVPKKNNSWKLDVFGFNRSLITKTVDRRMINVYNAKNTDDYYVTVWDPSATEIVGIADDQGTEFEHIEENNATSTKNVTYYGYVRNITDGYSLTIDGNEIKIY